MTALICHSGNQKRTARPRSSKKKKKNLIHYYCYFSPQKIVRQEVLTCCDDRNIVRVAHTFPTACNRLGNLDREEEEERNNKISYVST